VLLLLGRFDRRLLESAALVLGFGRNQVFDAMERSEERLGDHQRTVGQDFHRIVFRLSLPDVAGQRRNRTAADDPDMFVELVGLAVVEDVEHARRKGGSDHAFDEGAHDLPRGLGVELGVEGDHAAERGPRVGVARLEVDRLHAFAGQPHRRAGGVDVLHHRAGGAVEELDDVERVGDVFEVGLRKPALAVFHDFHAADRAGFPLRPVIAGGLVGVGSVAQVVHFDVTFCADGDFRREVSDMFRKVAVAGQFFCHDLISVKFQKKSYRKIYHRLNFPANGAIFFLRGKTKIMANKALKHSYRGFFIPPAALIHGEI